jgi:2-methylcitrate dehydratase
MNDFCQRLSEWTISRTWAGMSVLAQQRSRHLLIDTIGCALGGRGHPAVEQASKVAESLFGSASPTSVGLGSGVRRSTLGSTLDSGSAIRALDLNDFYWGPGLGGHPSDIFAVALAVSEEADRSVTDLLCAVSAGYEFYTRLMDLMRAGDPPWAWDHTSACAPSSALICGILLDLDKEELTEAIAISIARSPVFSALRAGKISSVKAAAPALGEIDGLIATRLAQAGMTGPKDSVVGPRGLEAIILPGMDIEKILPEASHQERVLDITIKRFPCMGTGQSAAAAAIELRKRLDGNINLIASIDMDVSDSGIVRRQTSDIYRKPDRRETADHSFYAIFGMALADGKLEPSQFASRRWADSDVVSIIDKLKLHPTLPGEREGIFPARANAKLHDGRVLVIDMPYAPGHRLNPIDENAVTEKYRAFAYSKIGKTNAESILDRILDENKVTMVRDVMAFCTS